MATKVKRELLEGDNNTTYFMAKASGRKRMDTLYKLNQDGVIEGDDSLEKFSTDFYKKLFGQQDGVDVDFQIPFVNHVSKEYNEALIRPFSVEEIK